MNTSLMYLYQEVAELLEQERHANLRLSDSEINHGIVRQLADWKEILSDDIMSRLKRGAYIDVEPAYAVDILSLIDTIQG